MIPLSHLDMVGVVGSSPIAPTKCGSGIKHLATAPGAFFLSVRKKYGKAGVGAGARTPVTQQRDFVGFIEASVRKTIQRRRVRAELTARGLASREEVKRTGVAIDADVIRAPLAKKLAPARTRLQKKARA